MKTFYPFLFVITFLFISNDGFAQIKYSLDSVSTYTYRTGEQKVYFSKVIDSLNADKYEMNSTFYFDFIRQGAERPPFWIKEYERFADNSLKSESSWTCWNDHDTCFLSWHYEFNLYGDTIDKYTNKVGLFSYVIDGQTFYEWLEDELIDSTVLDNDGRPVVIFQYKYEDKVPGHTFRIQNDFSNGNLQLSTRYNFNTGRTETEEYTYDNEGSLLSHLSSKGNLKSARKNYTYLMHNGEKKLASKSNFIFVDSDSILISENTFEYEDFLITEIRKRYNPDNGIFENKSKVESTLLDDGISIDSIFTSGNNMDDDQWREPFLFEKYFYSELTTRTEDVTEEASYLLYPNPVTNVLFINDKNNTEIDGYVIYNILGQNIQSNRNLSTSEINVSNLSEGTYFIKLGLFDVKQFMIKR